MHIVGKQLFDAAVAKEVALNLRMQYDQILPHFPLCAQSIE